MGKVDVIDWHPALGEGLVNLGCITAQKQDEPLASQVMAPTRLTLLSLRYPIHGLLFSLMFCELLTLLEFIKLFVCFFGEWGIGESTLTTTSLTILFSGLLTEYPVSQSHTSIHKDILNMT